MSEIRDTKGKEANLESVATSDGEQSSTGYEENESTYSRAVGKKERTIKYNKVPMGSQVPVPKLLSKRNFPPLLPGAETRQPMDTKRLWRISLILIKVLRGITILLKTGLK